jgi:uncharacterized protein (TIGR01777 family)
MKVVIAGGTGFLGQPLAQALAAEGREVVVLTRGVVKDPPHGGVPRAAAARIRYVTWVPGEEGGAWKTEIDGAAVVNLAGESIGARRWSSAQKERILASRVQATRSLAHAIQGARLPALAFISGSAVGYYGPLHDEVVREDHPAGSDFLARVCEQWESEAVQGAGGATRVVCIRTGLALDKDGGALPRMLTPFKLGVGGPLGSGRQYWPWIHRDDWVALVRWLIDTTSASGAINATAPHPVTNAEFTRALGQALHRPAVLPAPAFALRIALGEMADALLLSGQNAVPAKAERLGFSFRYSNLDAAFGAIFPRS